MNFLSRIIRYVFWVVVIAWGIRLLRWFIGGRLGGTDKPQAGSATPQDAAADSAGTARRLVRDPVCGMHVAEVLAIPLREGSEMVHFCSVQCRDHYAANTRKFAANG
jgi:hypothetical protein